MDYLLLLFQIRSSQRESLKFGTFFDHPRGIQQNHIFDKAALRLTKESRRQSMLTEDGNVWDNGIRLENSGSPQERFYQLWAALEAIRGHRK